MTAKRKERKKNPGESQLSLPSPSICHLSQKSVLHGAGPHSTLQMAPWTHQAFCSLLHTPSNKTPPPHQQNPAKSLLRGPDPIHTAKRSALFIAFPSSLLSTSAFRAFRSFCTTREIVHLTAVSRSTPPGKGWRKPEHSPAFVYRFCLLFFLSSSFVRDKGTSTLYCAEISLWSDGRGLRG